MSNTPTRPGTDTPEPILGEGGDDAVGRPLPDDGGQDGDLPSPDIPRAPGPDVVSPDPAGPL